MSKLEKELEEQEHREKLESAVASALNCETEEFSEAYRKYKEAEAEFKKLYEPFKAQLLELYKTEKDMPTKILIGGIQLIYVSPSVRTTIDSKKLKEEEPELAKKFTKTTNVDATLKIGPTIYDEK